MQNDNSKILFRYSLLTTLIFLSCAGNIQQINKEKFRDLTSEENLLFKVITQDQSEYRFRNYGIRNDTIILDPHQYLFYKPDTTYIPLKQILYASATPVSPDFFSLKSLILIMIFYVLCGAILILNGFAGAGVGV